MVTIICHLSFCLRQLYLPRRQHFKQENRNFTKFLPGMTLETPVPAGFRALSHPVSLWHLCRQILFICPLGLLIHTCSLLMACGWPSGKWIVCSVVSSAHWWQLFVFPFQLCSWHSFITCLCWTGEEKGWCKNAEPECCISWSVVGSCAFPQW